MAGPAGVDHEAVAGRLRHSIALAGQPGECLFARSAGIFPAIGQHIRIVEAGLGSGDRKDRHRVPAVGQKLCQQVRTAGSEATAHACHAVNLRECAQDDYIFALAHHVHGGRLIGEVNVRFVDQQDRAGRFIGERVFNIFAGSNGTCGIVGVTDIQQARMRIGSDHRLDVMGVGARERHLEDAGPGCLGGTCARFIAGIRRYVGMVFRGEREHSEVQRLTRPGVDGNELRPQIFLRGDGLRQFVGQLILVATAIRNQSTDGGAGAVAWPQRILICVDEDCAIAGQRMLEILRRLQRHLRRHCEMRLVEDGQGSAGDGSETEEGSAVECGRGHVDLPANGMTR